MSIKTFSNLQFYHFILMKLQEIEPTCCNPYMKHTYLCRREDQHGRK